MSRNSASGKGSIDERLRVASLIISEFKETDFPEELQATFREIKATLKSNLVDEQASEVALKIVRLYDKIVRDYCLPSILQSE